MLSVCRQAGFLPRFCRVQLHIIDNRFWPFAARDQSDSSHLIKSTSERHAGCFSLEAIGFVLFNASRLVLRSSVRYRPVVLTLTCPSHLAIVLRSTPERSR